MSIDISDLRKLPVEEKLRIIEVLWDDIASSSEPIAIAADQMAEIKRRSEELRRAPSMAIDRDELWRRVDG